VNLNLRKWGTLIILSVIWGSSYILIKKGLTGLTPVQLGSVRVIITTLLIAPIGFNKIKHIPKRKMKWVALSAFVGSFFPAYLFAFAETEISSSVTAVMVSLTPLFTLLISVIIFFELIIVIGGWKYKPEIFDINNSFAQNSISNTHSLGQILYTDYIHVFQISGMILLVAMVGAIVLTFRQRSGVKRQSYIKQISRERAEGVEVLEVQSNKGVKIDD